MRRIYPKQILPSSKYLPKLDISDLQKKYPYLAVVRQIKGTLEEFLVQTEKGKYGFSDSIFNCNVANLSMNLLGGKFLDHKHIMFLPKNEGCREWDGTDNYPIANETNFSVTEPCFGIYFFIKDIHNVTFPFKKTFQSQQERDEYASAAEETSEESNIEQIVVGHFTNSTTPVEILSHTKINHTPTQLNYWHIVLDTYPPTTSEPIQNDHRSSCDKKILKALKIDLLQKARQYLSVNYTIKRRYYKRELTLWDKLCDALLG